MPSVSKKEQSEVAVWRARIERSKEQRKKNLKVWNRNLAYLVGDQWSERSGDHEIVINKIFPFVRAQLPALIFSHPWAFVRDQGPVSLETEDDLRADAERARSREYWLNHLYTGINAHYHVRLATQAAFVSMGVCKVGYSPTFQDNEARGEFEVDASGKFVLVQDSKTGEIVPKLSQGDYLRLADGSIVFGEDGIPELQPGKIPGRGEYFVNFIPAENLLFDTEGINDISQHRYLIEEWVRPLSEVRDDPILKRTSSLEATEKVGAKPGDDDDPNSMQLSTALKADPSDEAVGDDEARVRGYEIWDAVTRRVIVVVDRPMEMNADHDFFLRDDPWPPGVDEFPYEFQRHNEVPGRWEPMPDISALVPIQDEYNMTRSKIMTANERADRKYVHTPDAFDGETQKELFKNGGDMALIEMENPDQIRALEVQPLSSSVGQSLGVIQFDFDEVSGQGAAARGAARSETATEASILEGRSQIRESDRRDNIVHDFIVGIMRKLSRLGQANLTQREWVSFSKSTDATFPYEFRGYIGPEDLRGELDVSIEVGSTLPRTTPVERQQFQGLIVTLSQNPIIMASPTLLRRAFEQYQINDAEMFRELNAIGQRMLQAQAGTPDAQSAEMNGAPGALGPDVAQVVEQMGRAA